MFIFKKMTFDLLHMYFQAAKYSNNNYDFK